MASRDAFTDSYYIVHITFTERLWWARHRPKNTDLSLIWWRNWKTQWEEKQVLYLASTLTIQHRQNERKNATGTKGVSVFSTRHSGKVGGERRARIL